MYSHLLDLALSDKLGEAFAARIVGLATAAIQKNEDEHVVNFIRKYGILSMDFSLVLECGRHARMEFVCPTTKKVYNLPIFEKKASDERGIKMKVFEHPNAPRRHMGTSHSITLQGVVRRELRLIVVTSRNHGTKAFSGIGVVYTRGAPPP